MKQEEENINLINRMVEKSIEAVLLAIEIYNKPTIKYRTESFAFYICNAWELLLKAWMLKIDKKIYVFNKRNEQKTISLSDAMKKTLGPESEVYTNIQDIITIRNTSTHYIIQEYEDIYVGLFQSSIKNYVIKLNNWFKIKLEDKINGNFILIASMNSNKNYTYLNYDENTIRKLNEIKTKIERNKSLLNEMYSVNINVTIDTPVKEEILVKTDINLDYPYRQMEAINEIQNKLNSLDLNIKFKQNNLTDMNKLYNLKENKKYYCQVNPKTNLWLCNDFLVDFIVNTIKKDNHILEHAKNMNKKKK